MGKTAQGRVKMMCKVIVYMVLVLLCVYIMCLAVIVAVTGPKYVFPHWVENDCCAVSARTDAENHSIIVKGRYFSNGMVVPVRLETRVEKDVMYLDLYVQAAIFARHSTKKPLYERLEFEYEKPLPREVNCVRFGNCERVLWMRADF